eukprot:777349-Pyramimonas_sp.AAC.1
MGSARAKGAITSPATATAPSITWPTMPAPSAGASGRPTYRESHSGTINLWNTSFHVGNAHEHGHLAAPETLGLDSREPLGREQLDVRCLQKPLMTPSAVKNHAHLQTPLLPNREQSGPLDAASAEPRKPTLPRAGNEVGAPPPAAVRARLRAWSHVSVMH